MATLTTVAAVIAGNKITTTWGNTVSAFNSEFRQPPLCQLVQTATQSIANNTVALITFGGEDLDPLAWHSTSTNTDRVTPTIAGWYRTTFVSEWGSDTDYTRILTGVAKNGSAIGTPAMSIDTVALGTSASNRTFMGSAPLLSMNGTTDYIGLIGYQTNTSAAANTVQCRLLVELVYAS